MVMAGGASGEGQRPTASPGAPATDGQGSSSAAVVAAAATRDVAKESPLPRWWTMAMQLAAALAGVLLLVGGYARWVDAPEPQIGKTTIDGKEIVVTRETTTTTPDKGETVVKEPVVAVAGRSETVLIAFLGLGAVLLVAAALPGRNLTLKAGPLDIGLSGAAAVAADAAQKAGKEAKEKGASREQVGAVEAVAAREAAVRYPHILDQTQPGALRRALGTVSGGRMSVPDQKDVASKAANETVEEARKVAIDQVLGPRQV